MTELNSSGGMGSRELSKREEREERILDVTAELLQKWGYRKTTMDDIARKAGVAKGTLYLSWKSRDALFMAVIEREKAALLGVIEAYMESDPEGLTLPGMIKYSLLATLKSPVMKALALQDNEFLGDLITREYNEAVYEAQMQQYMALLDLLRKHSLIRDDIGLREQAISVVSISWGFLLIDPFLLGEFKSSDEETVEMVATTLKRVLEPDIVASDEQRKAGQSALKEYLEQGRKALNEYLEMGRQKNRSETKM